MPSKCPVCSRLFNLTLTTWSLTLQSDRQRTIKKIEDQFKVISSFIPLSRRPMEVEIYRSIALFLIQLLIVDDLFMLRLNLLIYRTLFQHLRELRPQFRWGNNEIKIHLNSSSTSEFSQILNNINYLLFNQLQGCQSKATKDYTIYLQKVI